MAIALASAGPIQIGTARCCPPTSFRITTGDLLRSSMASPFTATWTMFFIVTPGRTAARRAAPRPTRAPVAASGLLRLSSLVRTPVAVRRGRELPIPVLRDLGSVRVLHVLEHPLGVVHEIRLGVTGLHGLEGGLGRR